MKPTRIFPNHYLAMSIVNSDFTKLKSYVRFQVKVSEIQQEMWAFVTLKENLNISFLPKLP